MFYVLLILRAFRSPPNARIGKTVICREVVRLLVKRGVTALYNDIEHVNSASELAGAVLGLVVPELGTRQKSIAWISSAYKKFSGGSITTA